MKKNLIFVTFALATVALCSLPPIHQSQSYHHFANQSEYGKIPNFWNVVSNLGFLLVAAAGWPRQIARWQEPFRRVCFQTLLIGTALTAFGSAYYHAQPSDTRLLWDRLPMTIVFMCVLTFTIEEQLSPALARKLFVPLLAVGILSVVHWRLSGDLRPYILVQFYPLILIPALLCFSKSEGTTNLAAQWGMIGCYALAKAAEMADGRVAIPAGAHAWKHGIAAVGILLYTQSISNHSPATKDNEKALLTPFNLWRCRARSKRPCRRPAVIFRGAGNKAQRTGSSEGPSRFQRWSRTPPPSAQTSDSLSSSCDSFTCPW